MRRFRHFRTGTGKSSPEDRQSALTGTMGTLAKGLNGKLRDASVLGDGTIVQGNSNESVVPGVIFQKPDLPVFVVHALGHTVYNWQAMDCKPGAIIGMSRQRPTRDGIWLEARGADVGADGKFEPLVVATIKVWGEAGQEPPKPGDTR